ncbi:chaperone modulator CbpM [Nonomuraea jiangxiensis]|uniref:MerR HTH family regulatory protein n=1 Tax=Nonomuraea jiangxiensis TaxID=633440 RepID=A0A1G9C766_9ACTN|nr:chaperone modulator CbpM [Nonomuraea jiangxiensis]SDK47500.1 MerR HTH family regulatory protein [Nonomuraea jiangxiensis]
MTYALVHVERLDLDSYARATGLHPQAVRRLVALGLLDPGTNAGGEWCFAPSQVAAAARIQRLHEGLTLNYAAIGVVIDLLDRIDELEAALRDLAR